MQRVSSLTCLGVDAGYQQSDRTLAGAVSRSTYKGLHEAHASSQHSGPVPRATIPRERAGVEAVLPFTTQFWKPHNFCHSLSVKSES